MTIQLGATLFKIAAAIYALAAVGYLAYLFSNLKSVGSAARAVLIAGLLAHTASLVVRTIVLGRPPFLNLYEYMLSFTWGAVVVYLAVEIITKNRAVGAFGVPLIAIIAYMTARLPAELVVIMPALRSAWRVPHIASAVLAYGAFAVAFVMGLMYLLAERIEKTPDVFWASRFPTAKFIDHSIYRVIAFGFLMQTVLVLVGAIWAQVSWGRYWGWDPKETWSLITWLIYAAYLHTRTVMGWRGRNSALLAMFGFVAVIFTLVGVNYLGGLHSYGK